MGIITDRLNAAQRDFETDGVLASGLHEVLKTDMRALGPLIETAIANAGLGALISVTKDTRAHLDADLAHPDGAVALVYADAAGANNDLYVKAGASGVGTWTLTTILHDIIATLAQPFVDEIEADVASLAGLLAFAPSGTQIIGKDAPVTGAALLANYPVVFSAPVTLDGVVSEVRAFAMSEGLVAIKRFAIDGANLSQVGPDYRVKLQLGANTLRAVDLPYIPVNEGDLLGFCCLTALVAYEATGAGTGRGWLDPGSQVGSTRSFSDAAANADIALQFGFTVSLGGQERDEQAIDTLTRQAVWSANDPDGDAIVSAEANSDGYDVDISADLARERVTTTVADTVTLAAPTGGKARYDLVYLDVEALTIGVTVGSERGVAGADAPSFGIPAVEASNHRPLFYARAYAGAVTFTPLWMIDNGVDRRIAARIERDRVEARRLIPKTMARIRKGQALRIVGFSDSIGALQSGVPSNATANGVSRDRASANGTAYTFLRDGYSAADVATWEAANPLKTAVQLGRPDDGAGAVHTRFGWNWALVAKLEAMGYTLGVDLFYDNWGIGGLSSADAVTGAAGSYAASPWLVAALVNAGNAPHVVPIALGMNERGDPATESRFIFVIQYVQAHGAEAVVLDVPRPRLGTYADWQYTRRAIRRAAAFCGAAFVPFWMVEDERIGGLGIDPADTSQSNQSNHPGIVEMTAYGRELERLIQP